ncbi:MULTISPECIES: NADP-dependent phosphogluconate dehydrogenase [unclassified Mesorhizobium]|uniref:NADP-dependent phosphogluconate dehydrogenase n=1 Tax=unclassified Mesorhizobium TaxID=325217 RepID=UPI000FCA9AD2|nr:MULTISPECIES: NADP-dependent phosphogluconate dehydrogenase [unclassified Mesorhizobium]TGP23529.1 NADP-dependent phosphogluconate dehydrogenase [Mesorhizobium sp. M1D.F.Ca.ET.231.01.1.1]TGP33672.1 NADP-dependent phosphogluconate dehydrogenase [Mesorhizobium sp. M1D.F.Ca.ET.234.01.1.1]TGS47038.1 NADP-dependent phosphogluconate dehydrogenase [Mesorhizobium sp. M1D.F.Ca.ET.184.01.1.1]TGS62297.1 NADP-dependent phosphogluconate dehydrogenase [Mesorhizobium sp. M1D.F.Ca.ET.183.01.1.1]
MEKAEIGLIGLGTMGSNLALNIAEHGHRIAVFNRTAARTDAFVESAGPLKDRVVPCYSLEELAAAIRPPRPIIIMVLAGKPVDEQIAALRGVLSDNDIVIDAGNANFRDTMRRFSELSGSGLTFIGMGVSGGEEGARHGPSIMVGGTEESWKRVEKVLTAISAKFKDEPCAAWLGTDGAGHFVKTIHNGIEYADMQMIAEIYGILRDGLGMEPNEIGRVFAEWNKGRLNSYLIEITAKVLAADDPKTGKPVVDVILDRAGQKGTGKWSVIEAQQLGIPATAIEAAVAARVLSSIKDERQAAEKAYGTIGVEKISGDKAALLKDLELALFAGKIAAYAQGFAVMSGASKEFNWNLPMPTIAKIWRAGCIIRSQMLDTMAEAFGSGGASTNLLMAPAFIAMMKEAHPSLRRIVAKASEAGSPVPALSSALAYFDSYRQGRGTSNLIQAQRDFFGAHGFERIGEQGAFHGPWGSGASG